jgi:hypothetical protein
LGGFRRVLIESRRFTDQKFDQNFESFRGKLLQAFNFKVD